MTSDNCSTFPNPEFNHFHIFLKIKLLGPNTCTFYEHFTSKKKQQYFFVVEKL